MGSREERTPSRYECRSAFPRDPLTVCPANRYAVPITRLMAVNAIAALCHLADAFAPEGTQTNSAAIAVTTPALISMTWAQTDSRSCSACAALDDTNGASGFDPQGGTIEWSCPAIQT